MKRVYDRAHEPRVRSTESLFWAFPGEGYLLQDRWEKIVWYNLVCRPHRELFTDVRSRGDSRGSEALGGVLLASRCESSDGVMEHHSFDACPVNQALERFLPSERERRINDAETLAILERL